MDFAKNRWLDISTAPKDGRDVLIYQYNPNWRTPFFIASYNQTTGKWEDARGDYEPTHWMNLEAPDNSGMIWFISDAHAVQIINLQSKYKAAITAAETALTTIAKTDQAVYQHLPDGRKQYLGMQPTQSAMIAMVALEEINKIKI